MPPRVTSEVVAPERSFSKLDAERSYFQRFFGTRLLAEPNIKGRILAIARYRLQGRCR
jgi:hypothetical protein